MISIQLENGPELQRQLDKLEKKVAKKIIRKAVRAGQKPVLAKAKENAWNMVGGMMGRLIAKNTAIRIPKKKRRGGYTLSVRQKPGIPEFIHNTKNGVRYYIPAAIEFGHAAPGDKGGAKHVAAVPFMRDAAKLQKSQSEIIVKREILQGIRRETR